MNNVEEIEDIRSATLEDLLHLWCYAKMPTVLSIGDKDDAWLPPFVQSIDVRSKEEVRIEPKTYGDVFCGEKVGDTGKTVPDNSIFHGVPDIEVVAVATTENHSLVQIIRTKRAELQAKTLLYGLKKKKVIKKADLQKFDGEWRKRHAKALESDLPF